MTILIKNSLPRDFPQFSIFGVIIKDLNLDSPKKWNRGLFIEKYYNQVRAKYLETSIGEDSFLKAYRQFYWNVIKVDPTKQRPASEALVRRFIRRKDLPKINPVVDIFNAVSAATGIAMCAYDFNKIQGELELTVSTGDEFFHGIGWSKPRKLDSGQLIIKDEKSVISLYPYRDADHTKITRKTSVILLTVDGVPDIPGYSLKSVLEETTSLILDLVGGSVKDDVRLEI